MGLVPGYNFVRVNAASTFLRAYQSEYPDQPPYRLSIISFLRMLQHKEAPPHRCLVVEDFERLWAVCDDNERLGNRIKQLLNQRANWITEHLSYVYFIISHKVDFVNAATFQLQPADGNPVNFERIFGRPTLHAINHYHRPFALS
jgi:hypothetical protein